MPRRVLTENEQHILQAILDREEAAMDRGLVPQPRSRDEQALIEHHFNPNLGATNVELVEHPFGKVAIDDTFICPQCGQKGVVDQLLYHERDDYGVPGQKRVILRCPSPDYVSVETVNHNVELFELFGINR